MVGYMEFILRLPDQVDINPHSAEINFSRQNLTSETSDSDV